MKRQSVLIDEFVDEGATFGEASHMYIGGDVLYSYGRHFPLLVRRDWGFVLNADKYSSSTSAHQSQCFASATIQLPFSTLREAGIDYMLFNLITHESQRWDVIGYQRKVKADFGFDYPVISVAEYEALDDKYGWYPKEERRPESAVIEQDGRYFLSSMDGQQYFICELPEPAETVEDAFTLLKPKEVTTDDYLRQGEWFFVQANAPMEVLKDGNPIPVGKLNKLMYQTMEQKFVLPNRDTGGSSHIATRGIMLNGETYVSGHIRHSRREHPMLKLSNADSPLIFKAYENRAIGSWSADGRVD